MLKGYERFFLKSTTFGYPELDFFLLKKKRSPLETSLSFLTNHNIYSPEWNSHFIHFTLPVRNGPLINSQFLLNLYFFSTNKTTRSSQTSQTKVHRPCTRNITNLFNSARTTAIWPATSPLQVTKKKCCILFFLILNQVENLWRRYFRRKNQKGIFKKHFLVHKSTQKYSCLTDGTYQ